MNNTKNTIAKATWTNPVSKKSIEVFAYTETEIEGGTFNALRNAFESSIKVSKVLLSGNTFTVSAVDLTFNGWVN